MSFILDALKKSESERQRQSGPALFEVKVAPPRNRFASWAVVLGGLLAINVIVVGWMLWRGGSSRESESASIGAPPPAAPAAAATGSLPPATAARATEPAGGAGASGTPVVKTGGSPPARPGAAPVSEPPSTVAPSTSAEVAGHPSNGEGESGVSPDDLAPAVEPTARPAQPATGVVQATTSGLPTYQEAAGQPGANIPDLQLNLHVYSPQPDQRFIFLNMMKLREGDMLPRGVRVERITPDGVILSYLGKEFVLLRQ